MSWCDQANNTRYLIIFLYLWEYHSELEMINFAISLIFNLESIRWLNQSLKYGFHVHTVFLIFEILDTPHLILELCNLLLVITLFPLQSVRDLLFQRSLSFDDLTSDLIEYLRNLTTVLIGTVFHFTEMIFKPHYLMLNLSFLMQSCFETHLKHVFFLLTCLL